MNQKNNPPTGYGLIYQSVMRDKTLSQGAKLLYCYLASFAGISEIAFPSRTLILSELHMGADTYSRYKKELQEHGIIEVRRQRGNNGTFQKNIFEIKNF